MSSAHSRPSLVIFTRTFTSWLLLLIPLVSFCAVTRASSLEDDAVMRKTLYIPVTTSSFAIGWTSPFSEMPLVAETPRGYIVELYRAPFSPPYGFIQKIDQIGNPTAYSDGRSIKINNQVRVLIHRGFIPLRQGYAYPIVSNDGTNLALRFQRGDIVVTTTVPTVACDIIPSPRKLKTYSNVASRSAVLPPLATTTRTTLQKNSNTPEQAIYIAIEQAKQSHSYDVAIGIMNTALLQHPDADNVREAQQYLDSAKRRQQEYEASLRRDLVEVSHELSAQIQSVEPQPAHASNDRASAADALHIMTLKTTTSLDSGATYSDTFTNRTFAASPAPIDTNAPVVHLHASNEPSRASLTTRSAPDDKSQDAHKGKPLLFTLGVLVLLVQCTYLWIKSKHPSRHYEYMTFPTSGP